MSGYTCSQRIFYLQGIQTLVKHWRTCIECSGDYVEQCHSVTEPICTICGFRLLLPSRWELCSSVIFRGQDSWPLKMGLIGCPEVLVRNNHYSLRNIPEERSSFPICTKLVVKKILKVTCLHTSLLSDELCITSVLRERVNEWVTHLFVHILNRG